MDDVNTDVLPTKPSAETPASGASDAPELEELLEAETAEEGQVEGADDELEDWEEEGKKYKVSKALKPRLMKDADYTRKTMEVAEKRKAIEAREAEINAESEFRRENFKDVARLQRLDEQIEAIGKIPQEQWEKLTPEKSAELTRRLLLAKDQRDRLAGDLYQKSQQKALKAQQEKAKRIEDGLTQIAKEIPGWSDELAGKLNAYGVDSGYTLDELEDMAATPSRVKTLHKAFLYDQLVAKQRARATTAAAADTPAPTPVPKVGARRSPPSSEPLDSDPPDVWKAKRDKQARAHGYR